MPATRDLHLYAGDTYGHRLTFTSGNAPFPLVGSFRSQIRRTPNSADVLDTFTVDATNAATGVLVLSLSATQTAALPSTCVWDLEQTNSGVVTTLLKGAVRVDRQVTR